MTSKDKFVICVRNDGCEDLELRKIYRALPDKRASEDDYIRVIDESGEDYLYPESFFVPVKLPLKVRHAVAAVA